MGGMPPLWRNHRVPTGWDTPAATAASSLDSPPAIASQNRCRCSRRPAVGRPGDRSVRTSRTVVTVDVSVFPSQLLTVEVLRRPIESTQYLSMRYTDRLVEAGIAPSVGSQGDAYDNALAESMIGLYKTEVIQRNGPGAVSKPWNSRRSSGWMVQHAAAVGPDWGRAAGGV